MCAVAHNSLLIARILYIVLVHVYEYVDDAGM